MLLKTFVFILSSPHVTVKLGLIYAGITRELKQQRF